MMALLSVSGAAPQQTQADPQIVAAIARIRAIDNHGHPELALPEGEKDPEEASAGAGSEPFPMPLRLRPENPEYIAAWRALYGYAHRDRTDQQVRELLRTKRSVQREKGESYPSWVLDQLGIEVMLSNREQLGPGLAARRFLWVPFVAHMYFPLDNGAAKRANPDYRARYTSAEQALQRTLAACGVRTLPPTLDEYLSRVVDATLDRFKKGGAVAIKDDSAYLRALDYSQPPKATASAVYRRYVRGGEPPADQYKALQDYIFRHIAREAGKRGLILHIHAGSGEGGYFSIRNANPMLLEPVLNDPSLRGTQFVLVHGGLPFAEATRMLLYKPNVYADFSGQTFLLSPRSLSRVLRAWLEFLPERVMFGTDAFPINDEVGWEELGWLTTTTARQALAMALTEMVHDGEITRERAIQLARMVLRENAATLYSLPPRE